MFRLNTRSLQLGTALLLALLFVGCPSSDAAGGAPAAADTGGADDATAAYKLTYQSS